MELNKILAITGKPGLYELKMQTRTGFVAESLLDGKKITIGMKANVSLLSEISIYTMAGEVKLFQVFALIAKKEDNGEAISHKSTNEELENYFEEVLPNYDRDRVYTSDIKKVVQWYNILNKKGLRFEFKEEAKNEDAKEEKKTTKKATTKKEPVEKASDKETKKAPAKKKTTAKKTTKKDEATKTAEKKTTAKKTTAKKTTTKKTTTKKKEE